MILSDKTILIVGASSGIGKALALKLANQNNRLIVIARRENLLKEVEKEIKQRGSQCLKIVSNALDDKAAEEAVMKAIKVFKSIDLAILNVGAGPQMDLKEIDSQTVLDNMNLNYSSMVNYLFPVLRNMENHNTGNIVHINSLAGLRAIPKQGPYSAAKGAARLLMEAFRIEYKDSGINFQTIYPGYVRTARVMKYEHKKPFSLSEEQAAEHILKAIEKGKQEYAFPAIMHAAIKLLNLLPVTLSRRLLMSVSPKKSED